MSKSSRTWTTKEHRNKCVQMKKPHICYTKVGWNMKLWGQGVQRLESLKSKWKIGRGCHDQKHLKPRKDETRSQWLKQKNWRKTRIGCGHHNLKKSGRGRNDRNYLKHTKDGTRSQWPKSPETYKGRDAVAMTEITWNIQMTGHGRNNRNRLKHMGCGRNDRNHLKHKKDKTQSPWPKSPET